MPNRNPLTDPRPGDVLVYGPQWQSERIEVTHIEATNSEGRLIWFSRWNGADDYFNLASWQELMKSAEVLNVAP
jgi:hypothetical protein